MAGNGEKGRGGGEQGRVLLLLILLRFNHVSFIFSCFLIATFFFKCCNPVFLPQFPGQ